jgi:thiosulfate dehydrogenase
MRTLIIIACATFASTAAGADLGTDFPDDPPPRPPTVPYAMPSLDDIPNTPVGKLIRQGRRIVMNTRAQAGRYVGNGLACRNCHLDGGRVPYAAPFVGLTRIFPEYRPRRGDIETLEERLNDCFVRSMNGRPLPSGSREMMSLLAYIEWLSQNVPVGSEVEGRGFQEFPAPGAPDAERGKLLYRTQCAKCHGQDGRGVRIEAGGYAFPPLWGPESFNLGAGMARISVAAAFIKTYMPMGSGRTLSDQDAYDIAAYFTTRSRPGFAHAGRDWPNGDRPADAR